LGNACENRIDLDVFHLWPAYGQSISGLHNSERSKSQIDQHEFGYEQHYHLEGTGYIEEYQKLGFCNIFCYLQSLSKNLARGLNVVQA